MRSKFAGYYSLSSEEIDDLWSNGVFVLDTNVLLDLYRVPQVTREKILDMLKAWKGRIWIPYQVGMEFHGRRIATIAEVHKKASSVAGELHAKFEAFRKAVDEMELQKRDCPEVAGLLAEMAELEQKIVAQAADAFAGVLTPGAEDAILAAIDDLIGDSIGNPPESQEALDNIYEEGSRRYAMSIGPGFEDAKKANGDSPKYMVGELIYEKQYGDLVLWKQMIAYAKESADVRSIAFLTKDVKKDWWQIVPGLGRISPLPELSSEIIRDGELDVFWMYTLEDALTKYGERKGVEVEQAIEDIRNADSYTELVNYKRSADEFLSSISKGLKGSEHRIELLRNAAKAIALDVHYQGPTVFAGTSSSAPEHGAVIVTVDSLLSGGPSLTLEIWAGAKLARKHGADSVSLLAVIRGDTPVSEVESCAERISSVVSDGLEDVIQNVYIGKISSDLFVPVRVIDVPRGSKA